MKRMVLFLTLICLVLSVTACGSSGGTGTPALATRPGGQSIGGSTPSQGGQAAQNDLIADNDACSVRVVSMGVEENWGFTMKLSLENKTKSNLFFSMEDCSIYGYYVEPAWFAEVEAGQTKESELSIVRRVYNRFGVTDVEEFRFHIYARDMEDSLAEPYLDQVTTVYPTGKKPEEITYPVRESQPGDHVVVSDDRFSLIITDINGDSDLVYNVMFYMENKTDHPLMFNWKEMKVNGVDFEPLWVAEIPAGLKGYKELPLSKDALTRKNIDLPQEFDFILNVYDPKTFEDAFAEHCTVVLK